MLRSYSRFMSFVLEITTESSYLHEKVNKCHNAIRKAVSAIALTCRLGGPQT